MIAISTAGAGNGSALRLLVEDNGRIGAGERSDSRPIA